MTQKDKSQPESINTGGGTYIRGNVNTGGGDFVGRDKIVNAQTTLTQTFAPIYTQIEVHPTLPAEDKTDLKAEVKELETELQKGEQADATFLERRLRNIKRMAPDILDVIVATLANPLAGFSTIAAKVAGKMKASAG